MCVCVGQINNAGCMVHKRELNTDGLEKNFATNTMGETLVMKLEKCCTNHRLWNWRQVAVEQQFGRCLL